MMYQKMGECITSYLSYIITLSWEINYNFTHGLL